MDYNLYVEGYIKKFKPDLILFVSNYSLWVHNPQYKEPIPYPSYIVNKLAEFKRWTGKEVMLVGQNPAWKISLPRVLNVGFLVRGKPVPERTYLGIEEDSLHWDDKMQEAVGAENQISYFSIRKTICNPEGCLVRTGNNLASDLMDFDYGHISFAGGVYVVGHGLGQKVKELLKIK